MAIGTPTSIGSVTATTSVASITITTTAAIVAGNLVTVAVAIKGSGNTTVSTVSDGTNTYVLAKREQSTNGNVDTCELWYKENAAAVASSASLVVTFAAVLGATNPGAVAAAVQTTGILSSSSLDSTAVAGNFSNSATTITATTGTLATSTEIVFGALQMGTGSAYTESAGFTNLFSDLNGANHGALSLGYNIRSNTTAVAYGPTVVTLSGLAAVAVPFKGVFTQPPFNNIDWTPPRPPFRPDPSWVYTVPAFNYPKQNPTVIAFDTGSTITIPSDYGTLIFADCIGAGGNSSISSVHSDDAGGGSAFARITSASFTAGNSYACHIGVAGGTNATGVTSGSFGGTANTALKDNSGNFVVGANGGGTAVGGGTAGTVALSLGSTLFAGSAGAVHNGTLGGGGGGAAGYFGAATPLPSSGGTTGFGGGGNAGHAPVPGPFAGTPGTAGTEYVLNFLNGVPSSARIGAGSGGTGGNTATITTGGVYGGGGPGNQTSTAGTGAGGVIVIAYFPQPFSPRNWSILDPQIPPRKDQTWVNYTLPFNFPIAQAPFNQLDWPTPQRVNWNLFWNQTFDVKTLGNNPFSQLDWPNPTPPRYWDRFWSQSPYVVQTTPFNQYIWPVALRPYWDNFSAQGFRIPVQPFNQKDWPLPTRREWDRFWSQSPAVPPAVTQPFSQFYWPLPSLPSKLDQFIGASYNPNLIGQDKLPLNQKDWPLPTRREWDRFWSQSPAVPPTAVQVPFSQLDWPLPQRREFFKTWESPLNIFLNYVYYPLAFNFGASEGQTWYRDWSQNLIPILTTVAAVPFSQTYWPNPVKPQWYQDWSQNLVLLIPAGPKPFNQQDWPNPIPPYRLDQFLGTTLLESTIAPSTAKPFLQSDWVNPTPVYWFRDFNQNIVLLFPPPAPPAFTPLHYHQFPMGNMGTLGAFLHY